MTKIKSVTVFQRVTSEYLSGYSRQYIEGVIGLNYSTADDQDRLYNLNSKKRKNFFEFRRYTLSSRTISQAFERMDNKDKAFLNYLRTDHNELFTKELEKVLTTLKP